MKIKGCVYIQAEKYCKQAVASGAITRFQVAEYLKEFYSQATGRELDSRFNPSEPKEFFRRWNGAKRAAIKEYHNKRDARQQAEHRLLGISMPVELLIARELRRIDNESKYQD